MVPFRSTDGKITGWKVRIPGNRPLATPAIADGKVFVGGGFGSHEFYAFDAATGKRLWVYTTGADGPTAAAVQDGMVPVYYAQCLDSQRQWREEHREYMRNYRQARRAAAAHPQPEPSPTREIDRLLNSVLST
ncbi:MAG TPA: PQQ-binding-like beta-propeller repeat protein [Bryobacteraceae bacterium]|nr:PQQ-binding-like beta-propeller repeat protein [Bryobacteraceae bacterium]